jgi:hypothetical protein
MRLCNLHSLSWSDFDLSFCATADAIILSSKTAHGGYRANVIFLMQTLQSRLGISPIHKYSGNAYRTFSTI